MSIRAHLWLLGSLLLSSSSLASELSPLLTSTNISEADWARTRREVKQQWQSVLGTFPASRASLKTETIATEYLAGFDRSLIKYQIEEGLFADGYLLVPRSAKGKLPAIVVFHPTTPLQAKSVAGVDPSYPEEKRQGVHLVKRGFIVWCPRNYIYQKGADWAGNAARVTAAHPEWAGMTRMVWDAIRAVDYLETLPEVDTNRIGCIGHSLGAKVVLYAMAFDERYKAGVFSEGGIGLKFSNWDAAWYFGPKIREPEFRLENHQVLALIAPRAFLLLAGGSADGEKSLAFINAVQPVYSLFGANNNLEFRNHHQGHAYPPEARNAAENFLIQHSRM